MSKRSKRSLRLNFARAGAVLGFATVAVAIAAESPLPPVPYPAENPPTDAKRVLGKMLFFEEQLSSDDTVACATCHVIGRGGSDPRRLRNPGRNGFFGDPGDVFASPGVHAMKADGTYDSGGFGSQRQVTGRTAPSPFASDYAQQILWDGRADSQFVDPVTKNVVIQSGGALESQALLPLINPAEMGHADRQFPEILEKLARVTPLALADRLPPDIVMALEGGTDFASYPDLFSRAFGDPAITAPRIAMAIATYERSLLPDRTDYDRFVAGDATALTAKEQRGLKAFQDAGCVICHAPPLFTDNTFRATGVRPHREDAGRGDITTTDDDRGRFRVPSLRNVALKRSFFHDGKRTTLHEAIKFYARIKGARGRTPVPNVITLDGNGSGGPQVFKADGVEPRGGFAQGDGDETAGYGDGSSEEVQFVDNQDPVMEQIHLTQQQMEDIETFLEGGLVDSRVQDEVAPFDRPTLASEHADLQSEISDTGLGGGAGGGGGFAPEIVVATPAFAGNEDFRIGLTGGPVDGTARLISWQDGGGAPVISEPVDLVPNDRGIADATVFRPLTDVPAGTVMHFVWQVDSPSSGGWTLSRTIDVPVFATRAAAAQAGDAREPVAPAAVDDTAAYVAKSTFRVDWRSAQHDSLYVLGRVNPRDLGVDLSQARVTVTLGGVDVVRDAALDATGRLHSKTVDASFDPATGNVVVSARGLGLRTVLAGTEAGRKGVVAVPLSITVAGLGIADSTVTTDVSFPWRRNEKDVVSGRFDFERDGTQKGTFQITRISTQDVGNGTRITVRGILDAPGDRPFSAPQGLVLRIGNSFRVRLNPSQLEIAPKTGTISAWGPGGLRVLRIDAKQRTVAIDVIVDDSALTGVPAGSVVPLRIRIEPPAKAAGSFGALETIADVRIAAPK